MTSAHVGQKPLHLPEGGQPPLWVPTALYAAVHSVRYHFVHSSAPNGPCAAIQSSENCEHLCAAAHYGDSDHFPVGTLHPLFNLDNFYTQQRSHRTAAKIVFFVLYQTPF